MNIEQANAVPLSTIIEKMGQHPKHITKAKIKYLSPYRDEKTPSFYVFVRDNRWYDYGMQEGGDVVDLVRKYLAFQKVGSSVSDALRWVKNMVHYSPVEDIPVKDHHKQEKRDTSLVLKRTGPLQHKALLAYGRNRGLSDEVLKGYLTEVHFKNTATDKTIFAFGMKNESGGFEVRNSFFKGCVKTKNVTLIRGQPKPSGVHVFEGMMDFLTVIEWRKGLPLDDDALILHSLNSMNKGSAFIRNYGYEFCYTWMDNDQAGDRATHIWAEFCREEPGLTHVPMNKAYLPHKDVNAAHMAKLGL